jgi:hypothetical protein
MYIFFVLSTATRVWIREYLNFSFFFLFFFKLLSSFVSICLIRNQRPFFESFVLFKFFGRDFPLYKTFQGEFIFLPSKNKNRERKPQNTLLFIFDFFRITHNRVESEILSFGFWFAKRYYQI